jgi:hypothetical protein
MPPDGVTHDRVDAPRSAALEEYSPFAMAVEPAYISRVRIERLGGPQRLAYLPAEEEPVAFGVHSEVAEHYGVRPEQYPPHATTLDYVVAAAGG